MLRLRERHQNSQQTLYLRRERGETGSCRSRFEMYDHIHGRQPVSSSKAAKDLANLPLDPVTHHGFADFAAGGDSEPDFRRLIGMKVDRHQRSVPLSTKPVATNKIRTPAQPLIAAKPFTDWWGSPAQGSELGAQAFAPFAATARDDRATLAGPHADTEAVALLTAAVVGLKCTLHGT